MESVLKILTPEESKLPKYNESFLDNIRDVLYYILQNFKDETSSAISNYPEIGIHLKKIIVKSKRDASKPLKNRTHASKIKLKNNFENFIL
ncbi:hypothetical protein A3Q56_07920 [Intoshia linei]|uniref:Uncharacterized protein n=1 Tax=Intoshia linei TaxID=1819745 RepID=A0A177ASK2_9BILA|nr:hypothetical protein A3Q56_07920 [Intoshia linei]